MNLLSDSYMKYQKNLFLLVLLAVSLAGAQPLSHPITGQQLPVSYNYTTSLLFSYPIVSVDRGNGEVLAQIPEGLENILQIKAAQENYCATNLTVITADGTVYSFNLCYEAAPEITTYSYNKSSEPHPKTIVDGSNAALLDHLSELAYHDRNYTREFGENAYGIALAVTGMYTANDYIFYRMRLENSTPISYDIDQLRFYIRDQKRAKRTASQDLEIQPLSWYREVQNVQPHSQVTFICVLPKFTIPDRKNLHIQLVEKSGGRHLQLKLRNTRTEAVLTLPLFLE